MAYLERDSQTIPVPTQIAGGRRNPFINLGMIEGGCHIHMNSYQRTTEAPVISAAKFGPYGFPNNLDSGMEWEPSPRPAMRSVYGYAQDVQVNSSLLRPRYGALGSILSDRCSQVSHGQLELYPDMFPSQMVGFLSAAGTAPGSQNWHMNDLGQNNAQYDSDFNTLNFEGLTQRPPVDLATHFPMKNSNSLEQEVPVPEGFPADCPPWSTVCRHQTEVPLVAATPDVPVLSPLPWHMEKLVMNIPSSKAALNSENLHFPMVSEHSKSQTSSEFTFISGPVPPSLDEVSNKERIPTDTSSQNRLTSRQIVWNAKTGGLVAIRTKRNSTKAERDGSKVIRGLGGQCPKCKKGKRKCDPSHIRSTSEASTTSSPPSTPSSLGSSWLQASSLEQSTVNPSDSSARRYGDHLMPPSPSHRQRVAHTPRPLWADSETWPEQVVTHYEFEGPMPHARSATPGSQSTHMLYLDARTGNFDTAMLSCEAGSNASSMTEWDNTNSSQAYAGLGGQFSQSGPS